MSEKAELLTGVKPGDSAIIVGVQTDSSAQRVEEDLDELETLLRTLGVETKFRVIQKRQKLSPSYLLGVGKVHELKSYVEEYKAAVIIFDHPLSGPQVRNIEKLTCCNVADRSAIILDIFAKHAQSKQAKTQVEIARLEYLLPRLSGAWTHFQRQTGGGVRARGMGEKQIEVDRRRARERISKLQKLYSK